MVPTIHLNGTSGGVLLGDVTAARSAVQVALSALVDAAPNARDYYPQGDGAFERAVAEHRSRLERLASVREELGALALAISDAINTVPALALDARRSR